MFKNDLKFLFNKMSWEPSGRMGLIFFENLAFPLIIHVGFIVPRFAQICYFNCLSQSIFVKKNFIHIDKNCRFAAFPLLVVNNLILTYIL